MPAPVKPKSFIPELDGLRGIAIALVMLYHLWRYSGDNPLGQSVSSIHAVGWVGVDVFFALSGFLIAGILLDTRHRDDYFRRFYSRRALRIFPLYYAVVTVVGLAGVANRLGGLGIEHPALENPETVWAHYLYLTNFVVAWVGEDYLPIDIAWSLAIEEQFYLVVPLLVRLLRPVALERLLWAVILSTPLIRWLTWSAFDDGYLAVHVLPFTRMDALAVGCLAALVLRRATPPSQATINRVAVSLTLAAVAALALLSRGDGLYIAVGYSLPAAAVAVWIMNLRLGPRMSRGFLTSEPLCLLGRLSYGLYLLHLPVRFVVDSVVQFDSANLLEAVLRAAIISGLSVGLSWLSWRYLELPILGWRDGAELRAGRRASAAEPTFLRV
jgi:peptidoglycan/LPS O-acetylase OafA/YrhL